MLEERTLIFLPERGLFFSALERWSLWVSGLTLWETEVPRSVTEVVERVEHLPFWIGTEDCCMDTGQTTDSELRER